MGPTPENVLWFGGVHGPNPHKCLCFGGIYLVWWHESKRPESALTSRDLESFTCTQSRGVCRPPDPPRLVPGGSRPIFEACLRPASIRALCSRGGGGRSLACAEAMPIAGRI
jgi:hypothetical protein